MEFGVQAEVRKESPGVCLRYASLKGEVRAKIGEEVEVEMSAIDHVRPENLSLVSAFCLEETGMCGDRRGGGEGCLLS